MKRARRSLFISFEGGEGAGKTSLINAVEKHLLARGISLVRTREPGGTSLGDQVRAWLLNPSHAVAPKAELALFLASRAQQLFEVIAPALAAGKVVLCDRFNDSTIAYQGVARGLGGKEVAQMCQFICDQRQPDLTLYLDIDPEQGLARAAKTRAQDRIEQETLAFHRKIRKAYRDLARSAKRRIRMLDASLPQEEVFAQAMRAIERRLNV